MAIISALTDSFWIDSPHQFPLVLNPSVVLGDTLILPILNLQVYRRLSSLSIKSGDLWRSVSIAALLSIALNSYSHFLWTQDAYTGFMDLVPGKLSLAGWWHLGFSILQSTILFTYAILWLTASSRLALHQFQRFTRTWWLFILFTLLNIPGFLIKQFFIFPEISWRDALLFEWSSFIPTLLALLIWGIAARLNARKRSNKEK